MGATFRITVFLYTVTSAGISSPTTLTSWSVSRPISGKKLEELREQRIQAEEDEIRKPAKFQRDVESG